ncbi:hypothetical protein PHLGIDRAFT_365969 [Phlebiopsis gigantea 11061_1 CR5-6]|uniref:Uncharacterized protein n=1 Tax=Phlebiopsis gigantea (strain 11061_1 CR5-6) TaxID=745531 RepID=A0A0C3S9W9_PHLG1|nr:hypothetical protein PHLGIDRAFT_365969 [Phlebiopsis gigantea 11061_1 CR5-6]
MSSNSYTTFPAPTFAPSSYMLPPLTLTCRTFDADVSSSPPTPWIKTIPLPSHDDCAACDGRVGTASRPVTGPAPYAEERHVDKMERSRVSYDRSSRGPSPAKHSGRRA